MPEKMVEVKEPSAKVPAVSRLSREELPDVCRDLGISREVLAGALAGSRKDLFTVDEVKGLVDKFLRRRVR